MCKDLSGINVDALQWTSQGPSWLTHLSDTAEESPRFAAQINDDILRDFVCHGLEYITLCHSGGIHWSSVCANTIDTDRIVKLPYDQTEIRVNLFVLQVPPVPVSLIFM